MENSRLLAWMRTLAEYFYTAPDFMLENVTIIFSKCLFPWKGQLYASTFPFGLFKQETRKARTNSVVFLFQMATLNQWLP